MLLRVRMNPEQRESRLTSSLASSIPPCLLGALILPLISLPTHAQQTSGVGSLTVIRSNYAMGVAALQAGFATVRGSGTLTVEAVSGPLVTSASSRSARVDFAWKPGSFKYIAHDCVVSSKDSRTELNDSAICSNASTSFALKRNLGSGAFFVSRVGKSPTEVATSDFATGSKFITCPYSMAGYSVPDLLSDPGFVLDKAEEIKSGLKTMIKVFFHYNPKETARSAQKAKVIKEGWVIASPQDKWATCSYELRLITPAGRALGKSSIDAYDGLVEYGVPISGLPLPKRAELKRVTRLGPGENVRKMGKEGVTFHDGEVWSAETFEFERLEFEPEPDAAFTLAAFGLPELASQPVGPRGDHTRFLYFGSAAAFLVAAIALRIFVSRRSGGRKLASS